MDAPRHRGLVSQLSNRVSVTASKKPEPLQQCQCIGKTLILDAYLASVEAKYARKEESLIMLYIVPTRECPSSSLTISGPLAGLNTRNPLICCLSHHSGSRSLHSVVVRAAKDERAESVSETTAVPQCTAIIYDKYRF